MSTHNEGPENRRRYPRTPLEITALVTAMAKPESAPQDMNISDLSYSGIRLECDRASLLNIHPNPFAASHEAFELRVVFSLLDDDGMLHTVIVKGASVYCRELDDERAYLGLEFLDVEEGIAALSDILLN